MMKESVKFRVGSVVLGTVTGVTNYGIFVKIDGVYDGLIHISEISDKYVRRTTDFVKKGESIYVQILDVDSESKRLKLSIKDIRYKYMSGGRYKKKIKETKHGFDTLAYMLPFWIEENLKSNKL